MRSLWNTKVYHRRFLSNIFLHCDFYRRRSGSTTFTLIIQYMQYTNTNMYFSSSSLWQMKGRHWKKSNLSQHQNNLTVRSVFSFSFFFLSISVWQNDLLISGAGVKNFFFFFWSLNLNLLLSKWVLYLVHLILMTIINPPKMELK